MTSYCQQISDRYSHVEFVPKVGNRHLKGSVPNQNTKRVAFQSSLLFFLSCPPEKYSWTARLIQVTMEQSRVFLFVLIFLQHYSYIHSMMQVGFKWEQSGTSPFNILARVATYHTLIVAVKDSRWFTRWFIKWSISSYLMSEANAQMWSSCSSCSLNHNMTTINFSLTV